MDFLPHILQDVDGFFYYCTPKSGGYYSANILREIADKLDKMNKPWEEQLAKELIAKDLCPPPSP